ncbi:MAG TPA: IS110 family transposase [Gemmatimonadales bacterium]|nr:IS110 family transposase [Gemmatimonadales bacterium]
MEYGAIDLHTRRSEIRIENETGTVVFADRVDTTRQALARVFERRPRLRILLESATESEWVAQCLEGLGHEVIVADPNYAPMYAHRNRRVKTDKRDVAALVTACRLGIYRPAARVGAAQRRRRQELRVRRHLVAVRTDTINLLRTLIRQEGLRMPAGASERILARLDRVEVPEPLAVVLSPLRTILRKVQTTLDEIDEQIERLTSTDDTAQRLMTAPGVGPIVALTFAAVLDTPTRFGGDARRATAFLGLVPREASSGERCHKGHITKAGPSELRSLLIQAAWVIWRGRSAEGAALRAWAHALAARRGRRIAIVALARRLARILFAMWRDQQAFRSRVHAAAA